MHWNDLKQLCQNKMVEANYFDAVFQQHFNQI